MWYSARNKGTLKGMQNTILYLATIFIWGTTWVGITFQLGEVDPLISVVYRFVLAAGLLLFYCLVSRRPMRFAFTDHLFFALQGLCLFALNYWLFYMSELYLASGLVAVIFSTIVVMNIINGAIFLKSPVRVQVVLGAGIGFVGICFVFWPELSGFSLSDDSFRGLLLGLVATFLASLGNIISARNQKYRLPVIQANAYGMTYGAGSLIILAFWMGKPFTFSTTAVYVSALIYLAVFGSVVAFGCYLTLVGRIGADRAAYATLLFPLIALGISTMWEGYIWSIPAAAGVMMILAGNILVMKKRRI